MSKFRFLDSDMVAFDDQMTFAIEGNAGMIPQVVDHVFYQYFEDWIEEHFMKKS